MKLKNNYFFEELDCNGGIRDYKGTIIQYIKNPISLQDYQGILQKILEYIAPADNFLRAFDSYSGDVKSDRELCKVDVNYFKSNAWYSRTTFDFTKVKEFEERIIDWFTENFKKYLIAFKNIEMDEDCSDISEFTGKSNLIYKNTASVKMGYKILTISKQFLKI